MIVVKFAKTNLQRFIATITDTVSTAIADLDRNDTVPPYTSVYQAWCNKGLSTAYSRMKITNVILGRKPARGESQSDLLDSIIEKVTSSLPPIRDKYEFIRIESDDIYHMQERQMPSTSPGTTTDTTTKKEAVPASTSIKPTTDPVANAWTTPGTKLSFQSKSVPAPTIPATPTGNKFGALEPAESQTTTTPDNNDPDISFDSSDKSSKSTEKPNELTKDNVSGENDIEQEEFSLQDRNKVVDAIANKTIHELDIELIHKWINTATDSIEMARQQLYGTKEAFIDDITRVSNDQSEKLLQRSKEKFNTYIKEQAETCARDLKGDLITSVKSLRNEAKSLIDNNDNIQKQHKKQIMTINSEIKNSESNVIAAINRCGNQHIHDLEKVVEDSKWCISQLECYKESAQQSTNQVSNAITRFRSEITDTFDTFKNDIMEAADDERDLFRHWMEQRKDLLSNDITILDELKKERDLVRAERRLMETERELISTERNKLVILMEKIRRQQSQPDNITSQPASTTRGQDDVILLPPISPDTLVRYKHGLWDVTAYVMNTVEPYYNNGWHYALYTASRGTEIFDCHEKHITIIKDTAPPSEDEKPLSPPRQPQQTQSKLPYIRQQVINPENEDQQQTSSSTSWNKSYHQRPLGENEFIYPANTQPKTVRALQLHKAAKYWDLSIVNENGIRGFYDRLQGRLEEFNIFIREYDNIKAKSNIAAITPENCTNYNHAITAMSRTIFILLDENKSTIFEMYNEPLAYIEAYRRKMDGLGLLHHLMKKRHPALKDIRNETSITAPKFKTARSIFTFLNEYIEWLQDEKIRNNRQYTQKEQLDYILNELDSTYDLAKTSIREDIHMLNLNSTNPKPFPAHLTVDEDFALYIISLLPHDDQSSIYNAITADMMTATSNAKINKVDGPRQKNNKNKTNSTWAKEIKWELLPGETCPACLKNNHNVYKTGCPTLATFAACSEFYKKTPKEKLEPVLQSYKQYQKELAKKLRDRRNSDKRAIRTLAAEYDDEDVAKIKKTFFNRYLEDFKDEQYCMENPYEDLNPEDPHSDEE